MSKDTREFEMQVGKEYSDLMREQRAEWKLWKECEIDLYKERPKFYKTITTENF